MENDQTKIFKFDENTIVQDLLLTVLEKLQITSSNYFSLVVEYKTGEIYKNFKLIRNEENVSLVSLKICCCLCLNLMF